MEKSADAFRTISEVADDLVLPQHVLRFWETRFPQIRPLKRAGGRRYYRPADIVLLRAIRQLLYDEGYTIKGVQRLLKEQGARGLRGGEPTLALAEEPNAGFSEDEAGGATGAVAEDDVPTTAGGLSGFNRDAALREALGCIEDCERILQSLRRAPA